MAGVQAMQCLGDEVPAERLALRWIDPGVPISIEIQSFIIEGDDIPLGQLLAATLRALAMLLVVALTPQADHSEA